MALRMPNAGPGLFKEGYKVRLRNRYVARPQLTLVSGPLDAFRYRRGRHQVRPLAASRRTRVADLTHLTLARNIHAVAELAEIVRTCVALVSRSPLPHQTLADILLASDAFCQLVLEPMQLIR